MRMTISSSRRRARRKRTKTRKRTRRIYKAQDLSQSYLCDIYDLLLQILRDSTFRDCFAVIHRANWKIPMFPFLLNYNLLSYLEDDLKKSV